MNNLLNNFIKPKLNSTILLFCLINLGILFQSCQKDEIENDFINSSNYTVKKKSVSEIFNDNRFTSAFLKIPKGQKAKKSNRSVMEQDNNFDIVDTPAKVIETDSMISYTVLIRREVPTIDSFENLVITIPKYGQEIKAAIVKYNLKYTTHDSFSLSGTIKATPIIYDPTQINTLEAPCIDSWILMCCNDGSGGYGDYHVAGENCTNRNFLKWEYVGCSANTGGGDSTGGPAPQQPAP